MVLFGFPTPKAKPLTCARMAAASLCSPSLAAEVGPFAGLGGAWSGSGVISSNAERGERLQIASRSGESINRFVAHCFLARG